MTTPTHLEDMAGRTGDVSAAREHRYATDRPDDGRGWVDFAAVMFVAAALFNAIYGVAALVNDDYFRADELLFGDLSVWGTIYLVIAFVQVVAALLIFMRSAVGAVLGILCATLNATATLLSVGAYPIWSVIILAIDGLIIYALTVHGFGYGAWGKKAR